MPKTDHPIEREELMAYLDGELPADRAGMAAGHLERCRECQELAANLQTVSRRMMEWQVEAVNQEMSATLVDALMSGSAPPRRRKRWVWGLAGAGAMALTSLVVILNLSGPTYPRYSRFQAYSSSTGGSSPKIARTAQLVLTTREFDQARTSLEDLLKRRQGFLARLIVNAPADAGRTLNATLRIPADQRDAAISDVKKLGRVVAEAQTGEEVTSDYVDLEARLANARNTEQRLTEVLRQRTGKLADVLDVEKEISRVRGEIERMEIEKKALTTRVEFLTLEVTLTEERPVQSHNGFRDAAVAGYRRVIEGAAGVTKFLLAYGPSLLIWLAILFFPTRWAWRRFRRA